MRILGIERDGTACNLYRVLQPLSKLDELGLAEVQTIEERELGTEKAVNMALWADIISFQRPATEAWFNFIKTCRKHGKLIVSDYDDDPFNTSPLNPYYQYVGVEEVLWQWPDGTQEWLWSEDMISATGKKIFSIEKNINARDMFRLNFKKSDLVTCTTDVLKTEFLKINPNVAVLPNCINFDFFPKDVQMIKKEIRIGWQGGASHYEDLYMVKDAIIEILKKHDNVKFIYFGDARFHGLFKDAPQNQMEYHPWVRHYVYPYKLALLNLDIGLCPITDNVFNRNKSAIKWMEYSTMNVATIASNIPPYSEVITDSETGLLVGESKEAWIYAMENLIRDADLRKSIASNSYEEVYDNHNIETKAHLWLDAYNKILKPEMAGV